MTEVDLKGKEGGGRIAEVSHLFQNDLFSLFILCFEDGKILIVYTEAFSGGGGIDECRVRWGGSDG